MTLLINKKTNSHKYAVFILKKSILVIQKLLSQPEITYIYKNFYKQKILSFILLL